MEIVISVIAVGAACSCLFFLVKSDSSEALEQRKLAKQKVDRQQDKTLEGD
jgi:hypothetical protein